MLQVDTVFTDYQFTEEEKKLGETLTSIQTAVLQSLRAKVATEKLFLSYDATNPQKFLQDEAYLRGQLDILQHILDMSNLHISPIAA